MPAPKAEPESRLGTTYHPSSSGWVVPLGNEFEVVTDEEAYKTLDAAWSAGVRYYDVSPWYGLGLAERRFGDYLHNRNRDEYIISSKVGKLLKASKQNNGRSNFPFSPSPNNVVFD